MTLFNRVRDIPEMHESIHVCQNPFKDGCSVALISFPPTQEDVETDQVQEQLQAFPMKAGSKVEEFAQASRNYTAKPKFQPPSKNLVKAVVESEKPLAQASDS